MNFAEKQKSRKDCDSSQGKPQPISQLKAFLVKLKKNQFLSEITTDIKFSVIVLLLLQKIANSMYKGLINQVPFFENKDKVLIANLVPLLLPLKIQADEFVYQKGEFPNNIYFLISGRINFIAGNYEVAFKTFISGTYFGEVEIFNKSQRKYSVKTEVDSEFLIIDNESFMKIISNFPDYKKEMDVISSSRNISLEIAYEKVQKFANIAFTSPI
eukprot:TRINITY_DN34623_c0_g1_i1.p1 TRINITY_DN34623_c0_g1~~TRINITY_DN34623_c0_g1_i1.p1  ORF type:complete len:214 (+),score=33.73 TRINITY_DN34623_c0_g1_i1:526-1167(+)